MEIDWLEDFLALSSAGVFAKAADARNVSQSAFTRRIKNLEFWIGTPLFDRSVHPVILTPAGEVFRQTALDTIKQLETARAEAKGLAKREGEVLEFTGLHTLAISFFPPWMRTIRKSLGPLNTRVVAENFSGCVEAVLSGACDFMLCYHHPAVPMIADEKRYPSIKVATDRLVAVSAPNASGKPIYTLDQESIPLLAYSRESFLGKLSWSIIERADLRDAIETVYENSVAEALKTACIEGFGVAWLPELCIQRELESGRLLKVSSPDMENVVSIHLYRSVERSRSDVERFWSFVLSASE